jgi:opacity protein-like surface antigen
MKHFSLFLFISAMAISGHLSAQIKLNLGGGINNAHVGLSGDLGVEVENSFRTDYFISLRPEYSLSEDLSVSMDVQYSRKKYMTRPSFFITEEDVKTRMSFIEVIPQIEYRLLPYLGLYGGWGVAYRLNEMNKWDDNWRESVIPLSKKYTPSWVIGMRVRPTAKLSLHIHFSGNISDFYDIEFTDVNGNPLDIRSRLTNIQVGLSYQIF